MRKALENKSSFTYKFDLILGDVKVENIMSLNPILGHETKWTGKYKTIVPSNLRFYSLQNQNCPSKRKIQVYIQPELFLETNVENYHVYRYRISTAKAHTISKFKLDYMPKSCVAFQLVSGESILGKCKPPQDSLEFEFFKHEIPIESVYTSSVELRIFTRNKERPPKVTVLSTYVMKRDIPEYGVFETETSDGKLVSLSYNNGSVTSTNVKREFIPEIKSLVIDYYDKELPPEILLKKYGT